MNRLVLAIATWLPVPGLLVSCASSSSSTARVAAKDSPAAVAGAPAKKTVRREAVAMRNEGRRGKVTEDGPDSATPSRGGAEIRRAGPGRQEFWDGGRRVFAAQVINDSYRLPDGTWLLEAVTGDRPPQNPEGANVEMRDGKPFMDVSPRQLWTITPGGKTGQVSPADMDAYRPLPSPDGSWIAYSGCHMGEGNVIGPVRFYLGDRSGRAPALLFQNDKRTAGYYFIWARKWTADSSAVTMWEEWGENFSKGASHTFQAPARHGS